MEKYLIRKDIMNLNLDQWSIIEDIEQNGMVEITTKGFYELLGFTGGMFLGGKANVLMHHNDKLYGMLPLLI